MRGPGSGASSLELRISGAPPQAARRKSWGKYSNDVRLLAHGRHTQAGLQAQAQQVPVRASAGSLRTRPLPCPTETFSACQRTAQQLAHTPFEVAVHACTQKGSERAGRSRCWHLPLRKFALDPHPPCPTRTTFNLHKNPQNHHESRHWRGPFAFCSSQRPFYLAFPHCVSDILHCRDPKSLKSSKSSAVLEASLLLRCAPPKHTLSPSRPSLQSQPPVGIRLLSAIEEKQRRTYKKEKNHFSTVQGQKDARTPKFPIPIILRLPIEKAPPKPSPLHLLYIRVITNSIPLVSAPHPD